MKRYIEVPGEGVFDIVVEGKVPGDDKGKAREKVGRWRDAGATWWTETLWGTVDRPEWFELTRRRISQGPPRIL